MAEREEGTRACGRCEGRRWEALERRVEVVERKNLLLEAALLAVIDASAGVAVARGRGEGRLEGRGKGRLEERIAG